MNEYDDSFEADSTASDEEKEAMSGCSSKPSSSGGGNNAKSAQNDANEAVVAAAIRNKRVALSFSPSVASVPVPTTSPATITPGIRPVPVPLPVPVPVVNNSMTAENSTVIRVTSERTDRANSGSNASVSVSQPLPMPRSRGGAITSLPSDAPFGSESSQAESGEWQRATGQSSSKLSSSDSAGPPREIADKAARAGEGAEFQALSSFVAFDSERDSTATAQASERMSETHVSPVPQQVLRRFVAFPASEDESAVDEEEEDNGNKKKEENNQWTAELAQTTDEQAAAESPQKTPSETKSASVAPSSVFSTLSQHLRTKTPTSQPPQQLQPQPMSIGAKLPSLSPPLVPPPLSTGAVTDTITGAVSIAAPPAFVSPSPLATSEMPNAPSLIKESATAVGNGGPIAAIPVLSLPSLPPPGWAAASTKSSTAGVAAPVAATTTFTNITTAAASPHSSSIPTETIRAHNRMSDSNPATHYETYERVAPLPPPPEAYRMTAGEARVSELREASEAVERLVKAFAMLKGYGALDKNGREAAGEVANASVSAAATTAHRPGAFATVQVRSTKPVRGPRIPRSQIDKTSVSVNEGFLKSTSVGASVAPNSKSNNNRGSRDGERLAEGLALDCVLGLLQEHAKRNGKPEKGGELVREDDGSVGALWQTARPHYEVIRTDDFTTGGSARGRVGAAIPNMSTGKTTPANASSASSAARVHANPSVLLDGVPGIDVPLFDPRDRQSAMDLYNVVCEALAKYVLRRVRTSDDGPLPSVPMPVTYISAAFAWTLLLDVSSVCQEIARCAYDAAAASPSSVYPILVQFRGDAACAEVARAAMHCLPFEALHTADSSEVSTSAEVRGCLFRMACWVTQEQLWTVSDALMDTVRGDVVKRAKAIQYAAFSTAGTPTEVDPRLLVPPQVPMFSLRPLPNRRGVSSAGATAPTESRTLYTKIKQDPVKASAVERDLFDVPAAALQKVAYTVSVLSTNLLSSSGVSDNILAEVCAEDYTDVAVAVSETVSELLQDEAIKAAVQRRAAEKVKKTQMAKSTYVNATRQRKEQAIIDKAEREAEEMVQHILQEMRAQGVSL